MLRIVLAAAPVTLLYNYGSAILRSFGDTQRPLIYITIAGVVNVALHIILNLSFYTVFTTIIYRRYVKKGICKKI